MHKAARPHNDKPDIPVHSHTYRYLHVLADEVLVSCDTSETGAYLQEIASLNLRVCSFVVSLASVKESFFPIHEIGFALM